MVARMYFVSWGSCDRETMKNRDTQRKYIEAKVGCDSDINEMYLKGPCVMVQEWAQHTVFRRIIQKINSMYKILRPEVRYLPRTIFQRMGVYQRFLIAL